MKHNLNLNTHRAFVNRNGFIVWCDIVEHNNGIGYCGCLISDDKYAQEFYRDYFSDNPKKHYGLDAFNSPQTMSEKGLLLYYREMDGADWEFAQPVRGEEQGGHRITRRPK